MTVDEMLDKMTSAELTAWRALYQIEADERNRANEMARQKRGGR